MVNVTLEQRHTAITSLWNSGVCDAKTLHELTSVLLSTIYDYTSWRIDELLLNYILTDELYFDRHNYFYNNFIINSV